VIGAVASASGRAGNLFATEPGGKAFSLRPMRSPIGLGEQHSEMYRSERRGTGIPPSGPRGCPADRPRCGSDRCRRSAVRAVRRRAALLDVSGVPGGLAVFG
jgi:hypothetical protein